MNSTINKLADDFLGNAPTRKEFAALARKEDIGRENTTLLHYCTFLARLRSNTNVNQCTLQNIIEQQEHPSAKDVQQVIKKELERNPYGVMRRAAELKPKLRKNLKNAGKNEVRRLCLGELIQTIRTKAGLDRDNSNNKTNYTALWKTFLKAKERLVVESYPVVENSLIEARRRRLKSKATRPLRKRENQRQQQFRPLARERKKRTPTWYLAPRTPVTEAWLSKKLVKWAKSCKLQLLRAQLQTAKHDIKEHYLNAEKRAGGVDPNTIRVVEWNTDKKSSHVRHALIGSPSPIPADADILLIVEASTGIKRAKPQILPGFTSSTVGNCQIVVRKPGTISELNFVQPPRVDDGVRDSTEFLACKVKIKGKEFTSICAYFPPTLRNKTRITEVFQAFVTC